MKWLKNILQVFCDEVRNIFTDEGVLIFFIVVPALYPLLYGYLYSNEVVREVPVVAVDESHTTLSRDFLRRSDASADLKIVSYCADMEEAKSMIMHQKAYGIIHIPREFTTDLAQGRQAVVNLYNDMSGLLYYKSLLSACTEVSLDMNKELKAGLMPGKSEREIQVSNQPLEYQYVAMFNPQNGFCTFILPAVLAILLQQSLLLGVAMLAGTERERMKKGLASKTLGNPVGRLVGKGASYFLLYVAVAVYLLLLIPRWLHLPVLWHPSDMLLFCLPYLLSCVFFSISLSVLAKDRESCFLLFVFLSIPMLFLSGISWPACSMPAFWKSVSYLIPSTFGVNGFVRMSVDGALLSDVRFEYVGLWIHTAVYAVVALFCYMWRYRIRPVSEC